MPQNFHTIPPILLAQANNMVESLELEGAKKLYGEKCRYRDERSFCNLLQQLPPSSGLQKYTLQAMYSIK